MATFSCFSKVSGEGGGGGEGEIYKQMADFFVIRHLKIPRFSRTGTASAILNSLNDDMSASFP